MLRRTSSKWLRPAFRVGIPLLTLAVLCLAFVVPSQSMPAEVPPQITVTTNPSSQPFGSPSVIVTIDWCDDDLIIANTRQITLNGVDVTSNFSFGSGGSNCSTTTKRRSVDTVTLNVGTNPLTASICDGNDECNYVNYSLRYDPLDVTPKGQEVSKTALMLHSQTFQVVNRAPSAEYALLAICTGAVTDCQVSPAVISGGGFPNITYRTGGLGSTGTVKLRATSTTNGAITEDGWVNVTASTMPFDVSFAVNNNDNQQTSLCANSCFTARYATSTIPYISHGAPRNVTLQYDGDRVAARPYVYADVSLPTGALNPDYFILEARVNGGAVTFLNGEQQLRFRADGGVLTAGSGKQVRLAGQFNASQYTTGMHPFEVVVSAVYPGPVTDSRTLTSKLMVVKEQSAGILSAQGWTVGGIQRLYKQTDGTVLVVEGDESGVYFACTSGSCAGPNGDFSRLSRAGSGPSEVFTRAYPDSTKITFNSAGQMTRIADRLGHNVDFAYDSLGRIERIYDPYMTYNGGANRTSIDFWYGSGQFTIAGPGPNGGPAEARRATTVFYDATGRVISVRDPDNVSTSFTYDASGRLETVTDRRGGLTRYVYDPTSWKLVRIDMPQIDVDVGGGATAPAIPSIVFRPWQHVGVPTVATMGSPAVPAQNDTIASLVTDAGGHTTRSTVDRWGQPLILTDLVGNTTRITRSGILATSITDPLGRVDSYSYNGHLLASAQKHGQPVTAFTYDAFSNVRTIRTTGRPDIDFEYDAQGRLTAHIVGATYRTTHYPDSRGRDTLIVDPANHATRFHYDPVFGSQDSVQAAAGQWTAVRFDGYGRDSTLRASHQPAVVTKLYDVFNRDSLVYDGVNPQPTKYRYDNVYLTRVTDPKAQTYRFDLNALGWITRAYDPADTVGWSIYQQFTYDRDGLVKSVRNRRNQRINMQYDSLHRLTVRLDPTAPVDSFFYSPSGRVTVGKNAYSTDSIRLGDNGADTIVTVIAGRQFKRVHSQRGGLLVDTTTISTDVPGMSFPRRTYYWSSARGSLDSIRVGSETTKFGFNGELLRASTTWPGGLHATVSHTSTHATYKTVFNAATVDSVIRRTYAYDSLGRIVSEQRPVQAATKTEARNYAYDGVGQLRRYEWSQAASECTPKDGYGCEPSAGQVFQLLGLEYDPALNMVRQIDSTSGNAVTSTSFETPNRLTGWANITYQYDADGNRVLRRDNNTGIETIYAWSADGRLLSVQRGSTTLAYDYNAFGDLVRRRTNGVVDRHFVWDEGHLLVELNGTASSKTAEYAYYPGVDRPLALITGASGSMVRYYHQDERGNVIGLTSGTSLAQHNVYNPWGQLEAQIDMLPDTSRLGWKGLMREGDITNLYYARARWYDPESRRFMSEDPIGLAGGLNLYMMADNDPVNKSDPTGLDAEPGMCQYTTVGGVLDSWDFSGCGGGSPSASYIAVLLMAMNEPSYPSLDFPAMGPHGGGGGGASTAGSAGLATFWSDNEILKGCPRPGFNFTDRRAGWRETTEHPEQTVTMQFDMKFTEWVSKDHVKARYYGTITMTGRSPLPLMRTRYTVSGVVICTEKWKGKNQLHRGVFNEVPFEF